MVGSVRNGQRTPRRARERLRSRRTLRRIRLRHGRRLHALRNVTARVANEARAPRCRGETRDRIGVSIALLRLGHIDSNFRFTAAP